MLSKVSNAGFRLFEFLLTLLLTIDSIIGAMTLLSSLIIFWVRSQRVERFLLVVAAVIAAEANWWRMVRVK